MAIFKVYNGKKILIADVSKVKSVNGEVGEIKLHGENLIIGGKPGATTTIKDYIDNNKFQFGVGEDKVLDWTGNVLSTTLSLKYDSSKNRIGLFGKEQSKAISYIELDLESQIEWMGLVSWKKTDPTDPSDGFQWPTEYKSEYGEPDVSHLLSGVMEPGSTVNKIFLVVVHKDAHGQYNSTAGDVSDLIDVYTAGDSIKIENNEISVKINTTVNPANLKHSVSPAEGLIFDMPKSYYEYATVDWKEGFYIDLEDAVIESLGPSNQENG